MTYQIFVIITDLCEHIQERFVDTINCEHK